MKIKIIQVGKDKGGFIEDGVREYVKRLSGFCEMEIVIVKERRASSTFPQERCVMEEGEDILKASGDSVVIALDEKGESLSSLEFADYYKKNKDMGQNLCFVIGGPYGLSEAVRVRASKIISFSKMTFTHQMIRLFLLEQLYRVNCIISGKEYHHE